MRAARSAALARYAAEARAKWTWATAAVAGELNPPAATARRLRPSVGPHLPPLLRHYQALLTTTMSACAMRSRACDAAQTCCLQPDGAAAICTPMDHAHCGLQCQNCGKVQVMAKIWTRPDGSCGDNAEQSRIVSMCSSTTDVQNAGCVLCCQHSQRAAARAEAQPPAALPPLHQLSTATPM